MKRLLPAVILAAMISTTSGSAAATDTHCYELRTYYAAPGKLDDLNARFRNHTCKLFEKHGMVNIGYWMPVENLDNKLIYVLAHASRDAADKSWKAFGSDPEWREVVKKTEANGRLLAKPPERLFLSATDYSPAIKPAIGSDSRVFELRTYTASPGNLNRLHARFRNHTLKLFTKHGMNNIGYWSPMKEQKGAEDTLIYLLSHKSKEAADASFKSFRDDPDWLKARKASEEEAGGSLTVAGGVKSEFLKATDYSPMR